MPVDLAGQRDDRADPGDVSQGVSECALPTCFGSWDDDRLTDPVDVVTTFRFGKVFGGFRITRSGWAGGHRTQPAMAVQSHPVTIHAVHPVIRETASQLVDTWRTPVGEGKRGGPAVEGSNGRAAAGDCGLRGEGGFSAGEHSSPQLEKLFARRSCNEFPYLRNPGPSACRNCGIC